MSYADNELNELYKKSSGQKAAQKAWLTVRDACGADKECLYNAYERRIRELVAPDEKDFSYGKYTVKVDGCGSATDCFLLRRKLMQTLDDKTISLIDQTMATAYQEDGGDCLLTTYGVRGLYTYMEAAMCIDGNNIFIALLNNDKITVYHTKGVDVPKAING